MHEGEGCSSRNRRRVHYPPGLLLLRSVWIRTNDVSETIANLNDKINCGHSSFWRLVRGKHGRIQGHASNENIITRLINTYLCALFVWFFFLISKRPKYAWVDCYQWIKLKSIYIFLGFIWRRSLCVYDEWHKHKYQKIPSTFPFMAVDARRVLRRLIARRICSERSPIWTAFCGWSGSANTSSIWLLLRSAQK